MLKFFLSIFFIPLFLFAQETTEIQVGAFNIEWFPCKGDGEMMKQYDINLRRPPEGNATNIEALFSVLKELDIELLGVVEIVDPALLVESAKKYLGPQFEFIYAPSASSQKIGFLYDSSVLELVGQAEIYTEVMLDPHSWLRPAFRGYFKVKPSGMDFHAIVTHLKASPSGWGQRERQWKVLHNILSELPDESGDKDVVLMGDFNNVSKLRENEFVPIIDSLGYYWATSELAAQGKFSNYWKPDYSKERIEGSLIDHIFISGDAKQEYVMNSSRTGGMCAEGEPEYLGEDIPDYNEMISDHCPVFITLRVEKDND